MKTVYFIGARASFATEFKLPTMDEFFDKFSIKEHPHLSRFLENYFLHFSYKHKGVVA